MKMNKKLVFSLAAVLLVAVTTLTFAHTSSAATVSITGATTDASNVVLANTLTTKLPNSTGSGPSYSQTAPTWTPVVNVAGSITAGDVYDIDTATSAYAGDIRATVYLTNSGLLEKDYTYLNMKVDVYIKGTGGSWTLATTINPLDASDHSDATDYLTLDKGTASFILQGNSEYCISIDGGSYYCFDTTADATHSVSPDFYLDVKAY
jgi:hypothetical protein